MYDTGLTYYKIESPRAKNPPIDYLTKEEISHLISHIRRVEIYDINRARSELLILLVFTS